MSELLSPGLDRAHLETRSHALNEESQEAHRETRDYIQDHLQDQAQDTSQDASQDEQTIFNQEYRDVCKRTDRMIAMAMGLQWPGAILVAAGAGARTWNGGQSSTHPHLLAAIYIGGLITILPVVLAIFRPGHRSTRHAIAACQMLMSALLIHISNGRIETHFHVFGSLAFLAFYLDWQVLVTATLVTLLDHAAMGYYAPALIFGEASQSHLRLLEHVLWVVFCDIFLATSCIQSQRGLRAAARREAYQKVLVFQAYHDTLTGLGNRLLAQKRLDALIARPGTHANFALIVVNLDRFKELNDKLGYKSGDELLAEVGRRLHALIRKGDTLVRMGGDEFVLILDDCADTGVATAIATRILESINQPFVRADQIVSLSASIGICLYPSGAKDIEELFHHAEVALYKVKERGRNQYFVFDEAMRSDAAREMQLEQRVRIAVREQLFTLNYQPIVDAEGMLIGFEALLRWNDPVLGHVGPQHFVPVAERCGLIVPLGQWVLEEACRQAAHWRATIRRDVKMSVNVSPVQLGNPDFVPLVIQALRDTGLPPELLDLELTETILVERAGNSGDALQRLHDLGVRLSIDDFGTGYSSLSYLRDLPVHRLKIDRAFVRDIVNSEAARALIESMIEMGRTLHLRVLAEGVETKEQMAILQDAGCDEIQGFLISKAVPPDAARDLLELGQLLPLRLARLQNGRSKDGLIVAA